MAARLGTPHRRDVRAGVGVNLDKAVPTKDDAPLRKGNGAPTTDQQGVDLKWMLATEVPRELG